MSALTYGWSKKNDPYSFWLHFNSITRSPDSWKEELYATARAIANRAKKPIWIASSGGIDSEIACRAFFDQGIDFSVLTLEHDSGTNRHDIHYAITWCRAHGVNQKIVRMNVESFFTQEVESYTERYTAIHPFRYLQIKVLELIEEMGGFGVLCSGEQLYQNDLKQLTLTTTDLHLPLSNGNVIPLEWCKDTNTDHEPYFHFGTPELCLAYTQIPLVAFALTHPDSIFRHEANAYTLKRLVYQSVWPDLQVRYKSHGFEKVGASYEAVKARLRERFMNNYIPIDLPVTTFQKQLRGQVSV